MPIFNDVSGSTSGSNALWACVLRFKCDARGVRRSREAKKKSGQARIDATALAVIDCAADPIIALGKDKTVCVWNRAAEQMFGWSAGEVLGLEPPIIPRELRAEHHAVLERVVNGAN